MLHTSTTPVIFNLLGTKIQIMEMKDYNQFEEMSIKKLGRGYEKMSKKMSLYTDGICIRC